MMLDRLLKDYKVILASASPRRKQLFEMLGIAFEVKVSDASEPFTTEDVPKQATQNALNKAAAIALEHPDCLVVGADTIVVLDGKLLGKPDDVREAYSHLKRLQGREHQVITGICLHYIGKAITAYEISDVVFAPMADEEIYDYIATDEPMDKAGAYGIQGFGSQFIKKINGCYFNVMGFPIRKFYETLLDMRQGGLL